MSTTSADGRTDYVPRAKLLPVVNPNEFAFAAAFLEHGHIYGQCQGLLDAGAGLRWVYDPDPQKIAAFLQKHPGVAVARSFDEILEDPAVKLIAAAAIPSERATIGQRVMAAGKDYFTDKTPFTTLDQLADVRRAAATTGRKYMVYFSERLHVESAMFVGDLVQAGAIGRVIHVIGLGPHRLNKPTRPAWFFDRARSGGVLCDVGCHQCEQFLFYTGATDATISHAAVGNFANADTPEFDDFGEASLVGDNGTSGYFRVDWFTPNGLRSWGDGRTVVLGTTGYIELRNQLDIGRSAQGDNVYIVDAQREHYVNVAGRVGFRFFGELILDCLARTETAMTQAHVFKAAELCLRAQAAARSLTDLPASCAQQGAAGC